MLFTVMELIHDLWLGENNGILGWWGILTKTLKSALHTICLRNSLGNVIMKIKGILWWKCTHVSMQMNFQSFLIYGWPCNKVMHQICTPNRKRVSPWLHRLQQSSTGSAEESGFLIKNTPEDGKRGSISFRNRDRSLNTW